MVYTLKMFNTGQVTLPKKRRSQYDTDKFQAEEKDWSLIIRPLYNDDSVYYEDDTWFWIYFPSWVSPDELITRIQEQLDGE